MTRPAGVRLIAISGGSASGKSRLAAAVSEALGGAPILAEDDYYIDATGRPDFDPATYNFDEPAAKDHDLLATHLAALKAGAAIERPIYDFTTHKRKPETRRLEPAETMIVEGMHILSSPALRPFFDLKVFVDAPEALRLERRLARDVAERGRTPESVIQQFRTRVEPMHDLHVEPGREVADIVIANDAAPDFAAMADRVSAAFGRP